MRTRSGSKATEPRRVLAAAIVALMAAAPPAASQEFPIQLVAPGMNQTELQSVMGPPDYIQVKGLRQAWQFCPRRFFIRFLESYVRKEPLVFVTVWFDNGRVKHMRAYPGNRMGECNDFLAAFRWEDEIEGIIGIGGEGIDEFADGHLQRIK